jgi:hypothetical protein
MKTYNQYIAEATISQLKTRLIDQPRAAALNAAIKTAKTATDNKLEMNKIQNDPIMSLGYDKTKNPNTGILPIEKEKNPNNYGSYSVKKNKISISDKLSPERYKSVSTHELGHAGSVEANSIKIKKAADGSSDLSNMGGKKSEELRQRRLDLTYRTGDPRKESLKWTQKLHDRDQISLDKINDNTRNKARKILYNKYGAPDRSTMSDRDLGKTATGTIIPEEMTLNIRENFYNKLHQIREETE